SSINCKSTAGVPPGTEPPQRVVQPRREHPWGDLRTFLDEKLDQRQRRRRYRELIEPTGLHRPSVGQGFSRSSDFLIGEVCRISRDHDGDRSCLAPAWKILEGPHQGEREPPRTTLSVPLRLVFSPSVFVCVELNPKRILSVGSLLDAGLDVLRMEGTA